MFRHCLYINLGVGLLFVFRLTCKRNVELFSDGWSALCMYVNSSKNANLIASGYGNIIFFYYMDGN